MAEGAGALAPVAVQIRHQSKEGAGPRGAERPGGARPEASLLGHQAAPL